MTEAEKKTAAESTQSNGAKSKTPLIIGAIVVVVVVIAAIATFLMMNRGGGNTEEALSVCERNAAAIEVQSEFAGRRAGAGRCAYDLDGADEAALTDLEAAQEAVDALGEMPACPADGSAKDIEGRDRGDQGVCERSARRHQRSRRRHQGPGSCRGVNPRQRPGTPHRKIRTPHRRPRTPQTRPVSADTDTFVTVKL